MRPAVIRTVTVLTTGLLLAGCHEDVQPVPPLPFAYTTTIPTRVAPGSCHVIDGRADQRCTPGALNPDVTQETIRTTICVPGWTAKIRPPAVYTNLLKTAQMQDYGETGLLSAYKEDHIIPLEAGGHPTDPKNLFPQSSATASIKDRDENQAHNDVCSGRRTLADTQEWIVKKWTHS